MSKPLSEASGWSDRFSTEITFLLLLGVLFPFFAWRLPQVGDAGAAACWLSFFVVPLVASFSERPWHAVLWSLATPVLAALLSDGVMDGSVIRKVFELLVFTGLVQWMLPRWGKRSWVGPVAFLLMQPVTVLFCLLVPCGIGFLDQVTLLTFVWPGLLLLGLCGFICRQYSSTLS
jgi:hypothetical protein